MSCLTSFVPSFNLFRSEPVKAQWPNSCGNASEYIHGSTIGKPTVNLGIWYAWEPCKTSIQWSWNICECLQPRISDQCVCSQWASTAELRILLKSATPYQYIYIWFAALKMVSFHSYASLPEGSWKVGCFTNIETSESELSTSGPLQLSKGCGYVGLD